MIPKPKPTILSTYTRITPPEIILSPNSWRCILAHLDLIPANRVHRPLRRNGNLSTRHRPPVC